MNFSSIKEYFYKVYNVCYLMLLLPLAIFIFIYYQIQQNKINPLMIDEQSVMILLIGACLLCMVNLTSVYIIARKRLKRYASSVGLGNKLDGYYEVIFLRFGAGAAGSLLMAIGLLLTGNNYFGIAFIVVMIWMGFQWPTSRGACKALRLKGDEYRMVFHKTEKL